MKFLEGKKYLLLPLLLLFSVLCLFLLFHQQEPDVSAPSTVEDLGLMLDEDENGLRVLAVACHSPAERAGIQPGDLVIDFNDQTVLKADSIASIMLGLSEAQSVPVTCMRQGTHFLTRLSLAR